MFLILTRGFVVVPIDEAGDDEGDDFAILEDVEDAPIADLMATEPTTNLPSFDFHCN